jgi:hypothetical protein
MAFAPDSPRSASHPWAEYTRAEWGLLLILSDLLSTQDSLLAKRQGPAMFATATPLYERFIDRIDGLIAEAADGCARRGLEREFALLVSRWPWAAAEAAASTSAQSRVRAVAGVVRRG